MAGTPDTSVVVAGLAAWHPDHPAALAVLRGRPPIIAHVLVESFSVLTRLAPPRRLAPEIVSTALEAAFPDAPLVPDAEVIAPLLRRLAALGVVGGATYDALIAETARSHGFKLVTLDRRAAVTYTAVGVDATFIG